MARCTLAPATQRSLTRRGTEHRRRGVRAPLAMRTSGFGLIPVANATLQAVFRQQSRSSAPTLRFLGEPNPLKPSPDVGATGSFTLSVLRAPRSTGRGGRLLDVLFEQLYRLLVYLGGLRAPSLSPRNSFGERSSRGPKRAAACSKKRTAPASKTGRKTGTLPLGKVCTSVGHLSRLRERACPPLQLNMAKVEHGTRVAGPLCITRYPLSC
jgi:hypothetical protein